MRLLQPIRTLQYCSVLVKCYLGGSDDEYDIVPTMTDRELLRRLRRAGCIEVRQRGSHVVVRCGDCQTTIPVHAGRDLPRGTLGAIRRDLRPCLAPEVFNALFP